jgi:uridine kinase
MRGAALHREPIGDDADPDRFVPAAGASGSGGIDLLAGAVLEARDRHAAPGALIVAITGIDAGGKGHVAARLAARLRDCGRRVAVLHADGWLNLPQHRFSPFRPAAHFYEHALRLHEMFERLIEPLRAHGRVRLIAEHAEETASAFRPERYDLDRVEIVLVEGIFLLKREYQDQFDLTVWVNCTGETALARARARVQEGWSPAATVAAYRTIYFPAQVLHQERDRPHEVADLVYDNDPRLGPVGRVSLGLMAVTDGSPPPDYSESRRARPHRNA